MGFRITRLRTRPACLRCPRQTRRVRHLRRLHPRLIDSPVDWVRQAGQICRFVVSSAVCYPVCYRDLHYFGAKRRRRIGARGLERGINARYGAFLTLITRLSVLLLWSYLASLLAFGIYKGFVLNQG